MTVLFFSFVMIPQSKLQHRPSVIDPVGSSKFLMECVERLSGNSSKDIIDDIRSFGEHDYHRASELAVGAEKNHAWLEQYDAFGRRIDEIHVSHEWNSLKAMSATIGIAAIPYEKNDPSARVHWCAKHILYSPVSGLHSCPLAMTDGAARCLSDYLSSKYSANDSEEVRSRLQDSVKKLTTRDAKSFWTSGQWMTEYHGGSDVGGSTITAACRIDPVDRDSEKGFFTHKLTGFKWFTSATDADMSLVLAREYHTETGHPIEGTRGLSLFYVELRDPKTKQLKPSIQVVRLKDKLGTRQMATAELVLAGLPARRIGEAGRGVATISTMLNVTRLHNSIAAVGFMTRALMLFANHAENRSVFGRLAADQPMQRALCEALEVDARAITISTIELSAIVGRSENKCASPTDLNLLRLITPVLKLWTAKVTTKCVQECLEGWGGVGYIEQSGMPNILRDCHVLPVWEGTTNVLSMDVIRVIGGKGGQNTLDSFIAWVQDAVSQARLKTNWALNPSLKEVWDEFDSVGQNLRHLVNIILKDGRRDLGRSLSYSFAKTFAATCLLTHAVWKRTESDCAFDVEVVRRFVCGGSLNGDCKFGLVEKVDLNQLTISNRIPIMGASGVLLNVGVAKL